MTFNHYLPPKTMAFIVKLGDENNLSWKEVERILLNKLAFELGMVCVHRRIGYSKTDHKPYCKDCWTRFQQVKERQYSPETKHWSTVDKFVPIDTFLDELENKKDLQVHGEGQVTPEDRDQYV
jgi:hypothetical protein